jgi:hypothetical protein
MLRKSSLDSVECLQCAYDCEAQAQCGSDPERRRWLLDLAARGRGDIRVF